MLPDLPPTNFERTGQLALARAEMRQGQRDFWKSVVPLALLYVSPQNVLGARGYRLWTLEQMELAAAYLLGPEEAMRAGEVGMYATWDYYGRNYSVAITTAHVLVFRIDALEGQPRWVVLAARAVDAKIEARTGWFGRMWPGLDVRGWNGRWTINGFEGFDAEPVVEAWRQAVSSAAPMA